MKLPIEQVIHDPNSYGVKVESLHSDVLAKGRVDCVAPRPSLLAAKVNEKAPHLGPYASQCSTSSLPKLSVTSKVSVRTSYASVGSRVHFRSSDDVTLLEFSSPVDREYMRRCRKFH